MKVKPQQRERITITINKDLLTKVDNKAAESGFRNRSTFIERQLQKQMEGPG